MRNKITYLSLIAALLVLTTAIMAQDAPVSAGTAPVTNFKIAEEPVPFLQIGTRAFTQISSTPTFQFGKSFLESCTITNIGAPFPITFPGGLLYYNGKVYTWNQSSPWQLWMIDTVTGVHTFIFNMAGIPLPNLTGMYWDGVNVYGVATNLSTSQIFIVNMNNGACTLIGTPSATCAGAIFLAGRMGSQYSAFSVDIVLDNFYKWNKTTGVATLVGPIGGNANFGQDACFDNNDFKLYWVSYTSGPQLRTLDTATGTAGPVLCTYNAQATGIACPFSIVPPLVHDFSAGPFLGLQSIYIINSTVQIRGRISNNGQSNETAVPVKFLVDGAQVGSSINVSLNSGQSDSVLFLWTPNSPGTHNIRIVTALATDQYRSNDTVSTNVPVFPALPVPSVFNGCRNHLNLVILANQNMYDTIMVTIPQNACYIVDVNVKIDTLTHTWDSDLEIYLRHFGVEVFIINHVGGSGDNFIGTNLNDSAAIPISSGTPPFTGTYRPSFPLSAFNGLAYAGGPWVLRLFDGQGGDTGTLYAWCITVTYYLCSGGIQTITVPNYYALGQNYPNPFNPATKIDYAIPRPGDTKITVYDILGREVAVLVNEFKYPGIYTIDFDASSLSSGVYFYKMESGSFTDTKKMLVIK